MNNLYRTLALVLLSAPAFAQTDSLKINRLEDVVVTGQFKPQSVKNSVYQVRIISGEKIRRQAATRLQDVLNNELNIRFSQDVATGGSDITMMGLRGQNVKILLDGVPLIGRQGTSNEININQVDINTIERIEIVEGPMSVVYGADALAGVINIITKKAALTAISVTARLHEETAGNEYSFFKQGNHNQHLGVTLRRNNWEIGGSFAHNYFGGWQDTATGRELVWHKKDQLMANGFIGWQKDNFSIRYRIDGLDEIITNPGNFLFYNRDSNDTLAWDSEYLSQRVMHQLQASYAASSKLSFQAQSAYTTYRRQVFSTTVSKKTGDVRLNTAPGTQSVDETTGLTARVLAFYRLSKTVSLQPGVDINTETGTGDRLKSGTNSIEDYAFFISSEITPSKRVNIRPGLRFIKNSVYNAPPVIPSLNAKFNVTDNIILRAAYAHGFRSPSIRELYFNFFDANHQIIGNPDLKAETSDSYTFSATWKKASPNNTMHSVNAGGFYNDVKNLIDYAASGSNPNIFILTNIFHSKTAGFNASAAVQHKQWNVSLGTAYTGFYNDYSEAEKDLPTLQWSPEVNAGIGYSIAKYGFDVNLNYKFTGKRPFYVQSGPDYLLSEQKGYHWADLALNKKLFKYLTVNAGIRNLFDVQRVNSTLAGGGIHSSNSVRNIGVGRSYFAGLAFNWNH